MSRQFEPDDDEDQPDPEPSGHVHTTGAGTLVGFGLTGLVLGWLLRPVSVRLTDTAPTVGWIPVLALFVVALTVGSVAWATHRALHKRHEYLEPHRAVNRLVLAKSCAIVGALVAGGYFGYALSYLGISDADLVRQRMLQSALAGVAGVLIVTVSLLLERACRVNRNGDGDLP